MFFVILLQLVNQAKGKLNIDNETETKMTWLFHGLTKD